MGIQLREALRRLCVEIGWSYAVFWRAIRRLDQMQFVWEDGYCQRVPGASPAMSGFEAMDLLLKEKAALRSSHSGDPFAGHSDDKVGVLLYKVMANQVHLLGDGIVGQAGLTGQHKWIFPDRLGDYGSVTKALVDMSNQHLAGIQTVAVIPVLPHGVLQLGSTQMVMENSRFINQMRSLFANLGCSPGAYLSNVIQSPSYQNASFGMLASANQLGDSGSYLSMSSSVGSDRCDQKVLKVLDSVTASQPSSSLVPRLHGKGPVNHVELTTTSSTMMTTAELSQPSNVLHQHSQLENRHLRTTQVMFSHPDVGSIGSAALHEPSSQRHCQSQILATDLSSRPPVSSAEQLLSITESQEFPDKDGHSLDDSKNPQVKLHGCQRLFRQQKDSDTMFPLDKSKSSNSSNNLGNHIPYLNNNTSRLKSCYPVSNCMRVRQMWDHADHPNNRMLAEDSELRHPTSIQESYVLPSQRQQKADDNFHEIKILDIASTECDDQHSCYGSQHGTQGSLSSLDPEQESQRNKSSISPAWHTSGNDLFDLLGLDDKYGSFHGIFDDVLVHGKNENSHERSLEGSTCITQLDMEPIFDLVKEGNCDGLFSEASPDQLLDAVVAQINSGVKQNMEENVSCKTSLTRISNSLIDASPVACGLIASSEQKCGDGLGLSPALVKSEAAGSSSVVSACSSDKTGGRSSSQKDRGYKSQISLWVENGQNLNCDGVSTAQVKRIDEVSKLNRKRSRPGENPRPRPKDRQMIQDRVKELREIVPNGAKCSIDALLEKTIKHMLFLQSVTKHADKLKGVGEPKIMSKEGGLLLKDNFEGGATWAFEVGTQSMICPIIVEDLNPPRQMLVEMLCEERGLFLEIADLIRGLGLTILKGVMETCNDKIWARFAVEANRDVTRMEIFLSLVRLLEPNAGSSMVQQGIENLNMRHILHKSSIPATGLSDCLR